MCSSDLFPSHDILVCSVIVCVFVCWAWWSYSFVVARRRFFPMIVCSCVAYVCLFCYRVCVCLLGVVVVFVCGGGMLVWLLWFVFGRVVFLFVL